MAKKRQAREVKGRTVATNRRARFDYEIIQRYDAGLALLGSEVKSIRESSVTLGEGYARFKDGELWLYNVYIAPYGPARDNHEPTRPRKLLLRRRELDRLSQALDEQPRTTVVPLRMYLHNGLVKLEIGLVRGKRQYDKRQDIAKRDAQRQVDRALSERRRQ